MLDIFQELLDELGPLLGLQIKAEETPACLLIFEQTIKVQIELDKDNNLFLGSELFELSSGPFREKVLTEALKANEVCSNCGFLGYSNVKESLFLFEKFPMKDINGKKIHDFLKPFIGRAKTWKEDLSHGNIPKEYAEKTTTEKGEGFFGINS